MEKNRILFSISQCVFSLLLVFARGQNIPGFISLDCGGSENYVDESTGIYYTTDLNYLDVHKLGENKSISPQYKTTDLPRRFWNVRSFSRGRKSCYTIKPKEGKNHTYLFRASFMYGNYDSENQFPEFDLYLGADKWTTVTIDDSDSLKTVEIIHTLQSDYTHVCLVKTGSDVPFISVLELRLLNRDNSAYVIQSGSLELYARLDLGLSSNNSILRYKDDALDRIWSRFHNDTWDVSSTSSAIAPLGSFAQPSPVMSTVVMPRDANNPLEIDWTPNESRTAEFYICFHFTEIEKLAQNQTRELAIYVNGGLWYGPFVPKYLIAFTVYSLKTVEVSSMHVQIIRTENSTLPPVLSAFEIYTVKPMFQSLTDQDDVDAITKIKSVYEVRLEPAFFVERDWQGDPCTPSDYKWGGLDCSFNDFDPPRIISLNLSSSKLTGVITPSIAGLKMLHILDLSNNSLGGSVPEFLSEMPSLSVLNLENNNFSGTLPIGLQEKVNEGSIKLRADGNLNLCLTSPCKKPDDKKKKSNNNNKVLIPVVSVAGFVVLLSSAGLIIWCLKRKKQQQGQKLSPVFDTTEEDLEFRKHKFTYSQILSITNNFEHIIGKGGFGRVYHGFFIDSQVAVKMLSRLSEQGSKQFKTEAKLLTRLHHRNLTDFVGYCDEAPHIGLVYEYMSNGDLASHLSGKNSHPLNWEKRLKIAVDTSQGLEYLHSGCKPPIIHRDVKTTNILLNEKLQAKLSDFGLSRAFTLEEDTHVSTIIAGTPGYLDPEYYISNRLTEKSDVFSFGVVLLEIITGRTAIIKDANNGKNHIIDWVKILISRGDIATIVDPRLSSLDEPEFNKDSVWKAVELAMACVSNASNKRPVMSQVVLELKQCLSMEMAMRTNTTATTKTESSDFFRAMPINTDMGPLPR